MSALRDLLSHKRTWALIVGLVWQALAPVLHLAMDDPAAQYILTHLPYLLAALWTALVLGQAYEDRVTRGASSALSTAGRRRRWRHALVQLLANEAFAATLLGTVLAVVALCVPYWSGLEELEGICTRLAQLTTGLCVALTGSLKYSAAHRGPPTSTE